MSLKVINSSANNNAITITFSDPVVSDTATNPVSAINPANYTIFDPGSMDFNQPQTVALAFSPNPPVLDVVGSRFLTIPFVPSSGSGTKEFQNGDWVHITIRNVQSTSGDALEGGHVSIVRQIPGKSESERATRDVEDAVTYPILTEQVRFPRSGGGPSAGVSSSQSGAPIGQTAALAIGDVLGWKVSNTDPKGFVGALTQAFTLNDVEGHVESTWNPRTYAVQTDLGGGISGAQASLYTRAKDALDQSLSLLDGLYPLDPDADPEYVKALREMARSQMTEIVKEFGAVGLPSILRIDTYFEILLGQHPTRHSTPVQFDPDQIKGTLGQLRDTYGIYFRGNPFNNSIEDEQDITNFRVISDYMTSLLQSWIANREFFVVGPHRAAFFGTQLVLISRQLNVIAETVDEVRFALDSVFIGPNERQTLLLKFTDHHRFPPMFLEDVLEEIEKFVEDEGPRLLRDGGKISVTNNILPVVKSLKHMIEQARDPENKKDLPDGFKTARVRHSLDDLRDQLGELIKLTTQVEQRVPFPEGDLRIDGVSAISFPDPQDDDNHLATLSFFGNGIDYGASVTLHSNAVLTDSSYQVEFYSAERLDVTFGATGSDGKTPILANGAHEITITNPDGERSTFCFTFAWQGGADTPVVAPINRDFERGNGDGGAASTVGVQAIRRPSASQTTARPPAQNAGALGTQPRPAPLAETPAAPTLSSPSQGQPAQSEAAIEPITALHKRVEIHETLLKQLDEKLSAILERIKK
jgi:hypothetical protein